VTASALRRGSEVALLKTLGVTRPGITVLLFTEYGLAGLVAGTVGAGAAFLLAYCYLTFVAEFTVTLPLLAFPVSALGCALLTAVCGVAASVRAINVRPIEALR
jgi:ABC-type antimicrobial peptide transport system permease subunit